jgi:hypothetical protein
MEGIKLDDITLNHHCDRVRKYFQLASDSTMLEVLQWCTHTYCTDNFLQALLIALDTVIAGNYELHSNK